MVACLLTAATSFAQIAAAKKVALITKAETTTSISVQHAYSVVGEFGKYPQLSKGLIKTVKNVKGMADAIEVTLKDGSKYILETTPNTNYNTISFSVKSPKGYESIGFIVIVDEAGDNSKVSFAASGDASKEVREKAKKLLDPIFNNILSSLKAM